MEENNEEVKKKKKIEISLGMAIFLFAIFLLIIVGVIIGAILISKNKDKVVVNEEIIQVNAKGIVYTAFEETSEAYSYSIPKININSEDVENINKEIEEKFIKIAGEQIKEFKKWKKEKESNQEYGDFACEPCNISYKYYINDEILSLIIEKGYPYEYIEYYAYNVNIKSGEKYTNGEILGYKDVSLDSFPDKLSAVYGEYFVEKYKENKEDSLYQEAYENTISKNNCNINNLMFLDEDGYINSIAKIYSLAGAPYYFHIIKIEDDKLIDKKEDEEEKQEEQDKEEKKEDDKLKEQAKEAAEKTEQAAKQEQELIEKVEQNTQQEVQEEVVTFDEHYVVNMFISYPSDWEVIDYGEYADIKKKGSYNSYVSIYKENYSEFDVAMVEFYDENLCPEYTTIRGHRWVVLYPNYPYDKLDRTMIACKNNWIYNVNVVVGDEADLETINKIINSMGLLEG